MLHLYEYLRHEDFEFDREHIGLLLQLKM